jgi:hypothetical protein
VEDWNPTAIMETGRILGTSTSPVIVTTNQGKGILKLPTENGTADHLVCEFVGTSLARLLDIPTPDFKIFRTDMDFVEMMVGKGESSLAQVTDGFLSRFETAFPLIPGSVKDIENKDVLTKLVFLDTWIRNEDRYFRKTNEASSRNAENIFLVKNNLTPKTYIVKAIDHSEAFKNYSPTFEPDKHFSQEAIEDNKIFGLFPEFREFLDINVSYNISKRLPEIKRKEVKAILNQIPKSWNLDKETKESLLNFIIKRAKFISKTLASKLFSSTLKIEF